MNTPQTPLTKKFLEMVTTTNGSHRAGNRSICQLIVIMSFWVHEGDLDLQDRQTKVRQLLAE